MWKNLQWRYALCISRQRPIHNFTFSNAFSIIFTILLCFLLDRVVNLHIIGVFVNESISHGVWTWNNPRPMLYNFSNLFDQLFNIHSSNNRQIIVDLKWCHTENLKWKIHFSEPQEHFLLEFLEALENFSLGVEIVLLSLELTT